MRNLPDGASDVIARQSGIISRGQALLQGMTESQISTRRSRGDWTAVLPQVYRSTSHSWSAAAGVHAAMLWAGPKAHLSGASAAWWWRLTDVEPTRVDVIVPLDSRRRSRPDIKIIRRPLPRQDQAWSRALRITGLPLTALYGAVGLGRVAGPAMLDRALQRTVAFESVRQAHYRNLGCWGSRAAGELLQAAADGAAAASERLLVAGLTAAGVGGWRINQPLELPGLSVVPDLTFVRRRVIVEVDGWAWHHTPDRFQRDRHRQNALVNAGWLVLRFTWFDLTERLPAVIGQIRSALAART